MVTRALGGEVSASASVYVVSDEVRVSAQGGEQRAP